MSNELTLQAVLQHTYFTVVGVSLHTQSFVWSRLNVPVKLSTRYTTADIKHVVLEIGSMRTGVKQ